MNLDKVRIGDLGRIVTGKTPSTKTPEMFDGHHQFVTPSDLDWRTYRCTSTKRHISETARMAFRNQFIPEDSVMVTCIGNTIGKCALAAESCLTNQQINSIVPNPGCDPKFLYYLMIHNMEIVRNIGIGGGAATPIVNKTTFSSIMLRVPPRVRWASIGRILSAYDDLIENNRRRIQLLERAARLLYKEWFVHLRFPGHEHVKIIDGVPEGWERKPVGDLTSFLSRGITPKYDDEADGVVVNQKCIRDRMVNLGLARRQKKKPPPDKLVRWGDVLVNSTGAGTLGRVAQFLDELENLTVDSHVTIVRPVADVAPHLFGLHLANLESYLATMGRGATNQTELSRQTIADVDLLLPPANLAEIFEGVVAPVFEQIGVLVRQTEALASARDLLLPRLMNGEIVV